MINDWLIVFFFIDDIIYTYRVIDEPHVNDFRTKLIQRFEIRDLGEATWFLGIKIIRNRLQRKLWINLESYFEKIATKFHLDIRGALKTPMTLQYLEPYEGTAIAAETHLFQKLIGSTIYPTVLLYLDVTYPVNRLSRYL